MSAAHSNNPKKLLTLSESAQRLGVSVEILLQWSQSSILTPTITQTGEICYKEEQINQFMTILRPTPSNTTVLPEKIAVTPTEQVLPFQATIQKDDSFRIPHLEQEDIQRISMLEKVTPIIQRTSLPGESIRKAKKGFYPSSRVTLTVTAVAAVMAISVLSIQFFVPPSDLARKSQETMNSAGQEKASNLTFLEKNMPTPPVQLNKGEAKSKYLQAEGENVQEEKLSVSDPLFATKDATTQNNDNNLPESITGGQDDSQTYASLANEGNNDDAIDAYGNIQGKAENIDELTLRGGIGRVSASSNMQLIFLIIGALAFTSVFWKQFAFATPQPRATRIPYIPADPIVEKVIEVAQKTDGTIVLQFQGKEFKVSKPELYSESDQIFERLMELSQNDVKELEFDSMKDAKIRITTPLSRVVTRLGFVGIKRDLFFPRTSKDKLLFRRTVTHDDLRAMNLTSDQIFQELTKTI